MVIKLESATLEDVARNYEDVIEEAKASSDYYDELRDLISECIGDDNIATVLAHPDAFKALDDNGFAAWNVFILDTENNIDKLIAAGYDKSSVLAVVADDIFYASPYADEASPHLIDVYNNDGDEGIKEIIRNNHAGINESYLDEIVSNIGDFCEEMLEVRGFLAE